MKKLIYNTETMEFEKEFVEKDFLSSNFNYVLMGMFVILMLLAFDLSKKIEINNSEKRFLIKKASISTISITKPHKVSATCYNATVGQTDSTPLVTADGSKIDTTKIDKLRWCAVSRDLEKQYKMGDKIIVTGIGKDYDGVWMIKDRMAKTIMVKDKKTNKMIRKRIFKRIDFLISKDKKANLFKNVTIQKL